MNLEQTMLTQQDRIRLIRVNRTALLDRIFDELCHKLPASSTEQLEDDIVAMAKLIQNVLSNSDQFQSSARGLFILSLQQLVDSFIAGALTEEAFEWLSE
jgi:hypothetical protein